MTGSGSATIIYIMEGYELRGVEEHDGKLSVSLGGSGLYGDYYDRKTIILPVALGVELAAVIRSVVDRNDIAAAMEAARQAVRCEDPLCAKHSDPRDSSVRDPEAATCSVEGGAMSGTNNWYALDKDHNVIPASSFGKAERRRDWIVAKTQTLCSEVSTVFLGLDHRFSVKEPRPVVFETLVFGGPLANECERYCEWAEAEEGHNRMVSRVRAAEIDDGASPS